MRIIEFYKENKNMYEEFVSSQANSPFLQSWAWGEFQQSLGRKVWRLGFKSGNQIIATATIISSPLKLDKSYLYVPRGPLMMKGLNYQSQQEIIEMLLSKARDICYATKKENEIFIRIEPSETCEERAIITLPIIKTKNVQPAETWLLDLTKDEKELIKQQKQKTRYNIKLSEKKGVKIRLSNQTKDLNKFLFLARVTAARAGFNIWPDNYYLKLWESLNKEKKISIWLAEYKNETLVANLVINHGDTVTYLHGGSANKHKEMMAPHYLQWQQILWAKNNGYNFYDFWGIASEGSDKELSWQGITRFKKSYGGFGQSYLGSYDFVFSNFWYSLYNLFKKLR
ncbi:peptidoglycan bridge formation glycyltransferase FemA/FemB family protein [Patescibacteria group bacterium]|nr:peptidoglycan bridge formation glycyltransferase FemA/FemB family protein [Patescibacteria group bacterium]